MSVVMSVPYLSICISENLSNIPLSFVVCLFKILSFRLSAYLSTSQLIKLSIKVFNQSIIYLPLYISLYLHIRLSLSLALYLSMYYLSLSIHLYLVFSYLSVCLMLFFCFPRSVILFLSFHQPTYLYLLFHSSG